MVSVLKYKNVNTEYITVSVPEKTSGNYTSSILYQNNEFLIQTPELEITSEHGARFKMVNKGQFFTLLEDLEETLVKSLTKNSSAFFKGKVFSEARIKKSLQSLSDVRDDGYVYLNNLNFEENVTYIDFFKEKVSRPVFPYTGVCMLSIPELVFVKTEFKARTHIKSVKVSLKKDKTRFKECFLGELSDVEEENKVNSSDVIIEDLIEDFDEDFDENREDFDGDREDFDELDFFD